MIDHFCKKILFCSKFLLPMSQNCLILSWQEGVRIATVTPSRMTESDSTLNLSRSTIFSLTISYCIIEYHLGKVSFEGTTILVAWEHNNLIMCHSLVSQVSFMLNMGINSKNHIFSIFSEKQYNYFFAKFCLK